MKRLYLSGPMTGKYLNNVPAFNSATKLLRDKGYDVVNPAELDKGEPHSTWIECLKRDIKWLVTCDAIATLPGWKKSRGANLEIYVGRALSYPIQTVKYFLNCRGE